MRRTGGLAPRFFELPDLPQNRKRAELARRAMASGVVVPRDLTA